MGATMLAAAVAIAVFSMGLKAASQEAVDLGNAELTAGVIELAAGAPGCDTGDGCFDDCTRWYPTHPRPHPNIAISPRVLNSRDARGAPFRGGGS